MKLRMSFLVTRPLRPVPSSFEMSTLCSCAILRTRGLDFVRRSSSAVGISELGAAGRGPTAGVGCAWGAVGGGGGAGFASAGGAGGSAADGSEEGDITD